MSRLRRALTVALTAAIALVAVLALAGCPRSGDTCTVTTNGSASPCPPDDGGAGGGGY